MDEPGPAEAVGPAGRCTPGSSGSRREPLRLSSDGRVLWDDEPSLGADTHALFRGDLLELWEDEAVTTCERFVTGRPTEWLHDDPVTRRDDLFPDRGGWFYLVRGSNCAGDGTLGTGSEGSPRPPGPGCP